MAMSQGELIWKRQQEAKRYLSRQQTKDCSLQTYINQAKASQVIYTPIPTRLAIPGTETRGPTERGINANVYNPDGQVPTCCASIVNNDTRNVNQQNRVAMKNAGAVICCGQDYSLYNGYSVDLSGQYVKGGWAYPLPNQPNTAKTTQAQQCASCLRFYFPQPAQPPLCQNCSVTYPNNRYYPPPPIDWELRRYGDDRIPQYSRDCTQSSGMSVSNISVNTNTPPFTITWSYSGSGTLTVTLYEGNNSVGWESGQITTANGTGSITVTKLCTITGVTTTITAIVSMTDVCGTVSSSYNFTCIPSGAIGSGSCA